MDFCVVSIQVEHLSWNPSSYLVSSVVQIKQLSLNVWICEMGTEPHVPVPLYEAKKKKKKQSKQPPACTPSTVTVWVSVTVAGTVDRSVPEAPALETPPRASHMQDKPSATALYAQPCSYFLFCFVLFFVFEFES